MEVFDKDTIKLRLSLAAEDVAAVYVPFVEGENGCAASIAKVLDDPLASYQQIFDTVWTNDAWTEDDYAACRSYGLSDDATPLNRLTLISAVGVALLDIYDERKLAFLCDMVDGVRANESIRAALFIFLFVARHPGASVLSATLRQRIAGFLTNAEILALFTLLQLNAIAVAQSAKLSVDYEKEIYQRTAEKLDAAREMSDAASDNPDEFLEDGSAFKAVFSDLFSIVKDSIKLRFRGVDVSYGSFAQDVSDYPFFAEPSNWFCPFSFDHPELFNISNVGRFMAVVADGKSCDTDRFALLFSLPEGHAEIKIVKTDAKTLVSEDILGENAENVMQDFIKMHIAHQRKAERPISEMPRFLFYSKVSSCVIDTYRFYQLYGREIGLANPFSANLFAWRNADLAPFYSRPTSREAIASWLQEFGFYEEAAELYFDVLKMLVGQSADDAGLSGHEGFALSVEKFYGGDSLIQEGLDNSGAAEEITSELSAEDLGISAEELGISPEDLEFSEETSEDLEAYSEDLEAYSDITEAYSDVSEGYTDVTEEYTGIHEEDSEESGDDDDDAQDDSETPAEFLLRRKANICHNLGICHSCLGNIRASQVYLRLSLRYVPDNLKVVRELADSYRSNERWNDALPLLLQLYDALPVGTPEQPLSDAQETKEYRLTKQLAHAYIRLDRYADALPLLVKADYKHPGHLPTLRLLAWAYLVCSQPERAEQKYRAILPTGKATPDDFFCAGHCALIADDIDLAVERYKECLRLQGLDYVPADFLSEYTPFLVVHGVDPVILEYIPDLINSL